MPPCSGEMKGCSFSGLPTTLSTSQVYASCPYIASFLFPVLYPRVYGIPSAGALKTPIFRKASTALICTARFALWQQAAAADKAGSQERPPHLASFDLAAFPPSPVPDAACRRGSQPAAGCTWPGTALLQMGKGPRYQAEPPRWRRLDEPVPWAAALNSHHLAASHIWSPRRGKMKACWGVQRLVRHAGNAPSL